MSKRDEALQQFIDAWIGRDTLSDIGTSLTCWEARTLANLLAVCGHPTSANTLLEFHSIGDDPDEDERHELFEVVTSDE